jgi:hypothetical protein
MKTSIVHQQSRIWEKPVPGYNSYIPFVIINACWEMPAYIYRGELQWFRESSQMYPSTWMYELTRHSQKFLTLYLAESYTWNWVTYNFQVYPVGLLKEEPRPRNFRWLDLQDSELPQKSQPYEELTHQSTLRDKPEQCIHTFPDPPDRTHFRIFSLKLVPPQFWKGYGWYWSYQLFTQIPLFSRFFPIVIRCDLISDLFFVSRLIWLRTVTRAANEKKRVANQGSRKEKKGKFAMLKVKKLEKSSSGSEWEWEKKET